MSEPEVITVRRFRCPFCHRSRTSRKATAEHIARCWRNPATRSCKTCANYRYYRGAGVPDPCIPGQICNCDPDEETCEAGIDLAEGDMPRVACPLWTLLEAAA